MRAAFAWWSQQGHGERRQPAKAPGELLILLDGIEQRLGDREGPWETRSLESACMDNKFSRGEESDNQPSVGQDDDVTAVVPRGGPWHAPRRPLRWTLTALGIVAVGFLAISLVKRATRRHPAAAPASLVASPAAVDESATNTLSPSPVVPAPVPPAAAPAAPAQASEPTPTEPALAAPAAPSGTAGVPSPEKASDAPAVADSTPRAAAEGNSTVASCREALTKRQTAVIAQRCEQAIALDASLATPILAWAKRELDRGNVRGAATWARRVLATDDRLADAYLIVGVAEQEAGHVPAAKAAYQRYVELAPKGRYARDVRLSLQAL